MALRDLRGRAPRGTLTFRITRISILALAALLGVGYVLAVAPMSHATTRVTKRPHPRARAQARPEVFMTTANLSDAMTQLPGPAFSTSRPKALPVIAVDPEVRYQRFTGIGAAMTDASAWLLDDELPFITRLDMMEKLFSPDGIHLNFLRVPMGASDFTVWGAPYSYDDMPAGESDPALTHFTVNHDLAYIIPMLRQARQINPGLQILANPWSPPGWMKANDSLTNNYPGGSLLPSAYGVLASYFVKFLLAYADQGVRVDAITPQNEPSVETPYPSLGFPEHDQASFILNDLAPALAAARLPVKIYGGDDAWGTSQDADALASSPAGGKLAGIAWHCYFGSPTVMSQLHLAQPSLDQIVSECSPEIRPTVTGEYLISALRNWASAALVWNIALEPSGGPVEPPNSGCHGCTGVITINPQTHRARLSRKYYQLGQVSKYVSPGAVRIGSTNFVSYGLYHSFSVTSSGLDDVAFLNPDGSEVLITYNNGPATRFAVDAGGRYFTDRLAPGAMATFVWDRHR